MTILTLTDDEVKVVSAALAKYHLAKSAEKMLKGHAIRKTDVVASDKIYVQYDKLLTIIKGVQQKVHVN